jgi:hypothetical protein
MNINLEVCDYEFDHNFTQEQIKSYLFKVRLNDHIDFFKNVNVCDFSEAYKLASNFNEEYVVVTEFYYYEQNLITKEYSYCCNIFHVGNLSDYIMSDGSEADHSSFMVYEQICIKHDDNKTITNYSVIDGDSKKEYNNIIATPYNVKKLKKDGSFIKYKR